VGQPQQKVGQGAAMELFASSRRLDPHFVPIKKSSLTRARRREGGFPWMQSARHDERLLPAGILTSYPHYDDAVRRVPTSPAGNPETGLGVGGLPGPFSKSARRGAPTSLHCQRFPTQGIAAIPRVCNFLFCHPERNQAKSAAIGLAESKDPYTTEIACLMKGVLSL
jgi:hypothetical protein